MTTLSTETSRPALSLHRAAERNRGTPADPHRAAAIVLFLAVVIATAAALIILAPHLPDPATLYVTVT